MRWRAGRSLLLGQGAAAGDAHHRAPLLLRSAPDRLRFSFLGTKEKSRPVVSWARWARNRVVIPRRSGDTPADRGVVKRFRLEHPDGAALAFEMTRVKFTTRFADQLRAALA
jgi:hypothetical protein